jgi:biotin carboxylase
MAVRQSILIIGGKKKIVQKAKALGLEVLYFQKPEKLDEASLAYVDHLELLDFEDRSVVVPAAQALFESRPFGYAISLTEPGLMPAAWVVDALGLPGNSSTTVRLLKDKWAMRERLNSAGISAVAAQAGRSHADLHRFANQYGLPLIVKPVGGVGSLDVYCVREQAEVDHVWQRVCERRLDSFLLEEYLDGPEISVEAFSFAGRHVVLAVTDKLTLPNFVEIGHSMPAQLGDAERDAVVRLVSQFLETVGLRDGPSHTELKLTARGPRIVESHNRIGGDRINEMVQIACGVDMDTLALGWPFGLVEALERPPEMRGGAAIRFFVPPPGVVREIRGVEDIVHAPGLVELELTCRTGSEILPVRWSEDRVGFVLTQAPSARAAVSIAEDLVQRVDFHTESADNLAGTACARP